MIYQLHVYYFPVGMICNQYNLCECDRLYTQMDGLCVEGKNLSQYEMALKIIKTIELRTIEMSSTNDR